MPPRRLTAAGLSLQRHWSRDRWLLYIVGSNLSDGRRPRRRARGLQRRRGLVHLTRFSPREVIHPLPRERRRPRRWLRLWWLRLWWLRNRGRLAIPIGQPCIEEVIGSLFGDWVRPRWSRRRRRRRIFGRRDSAAWLVAHGRRGVERRNHRPVAATAVFERLALAFSEISEQRLCPVFDHMHHGTILSCESNANRHLRTVSLTNLKQR